MLDGILEGPWSDFLHKGGPAQGVTQPGLESLNAQMENAHGLGGEIKCLYSCLEGGALLFGVLVYESQKNKVAILSQVLLTFLFTQTSSFLYLDEFRQAGNGGFIGARIQNHHFHQQCQLQLLKPHSPGALELPGKLKKRSKKNNSMKNMNLNSCVASQCCVLNIPTAT